MDRTEWAKERREEGWTLEAIGKELGVSRSVVWNMLKRAELRDRVPVYDYDGWKRDFEAGMSVWAVSRKYNVTAPAVLRQLRKLGCDTARDKKGAPAPACPHPAKTRRRGLCDACYMAQYRLEHGDDLRAADRELYQKDKETYFARGSKRRARLEGGGGSHTAAEWRVVLKEYGNRCAYCATALARPIREHVVPLQRGGTDDITNIVPACNRCNTLKGSEVWQPYTSLTVKLLILGAPPWRPMKDGT